MRRNDRRSQRDSAPVDFSKFSNFRNGDFQGGGFRSEEREMHDAKCADCGKDCKVPFVPKEGRPVFCRECYPKHAPKRF